MIASRSQILKFLSELLACALALRARILKLLLGRISFNGNPQANSSHFASHRPPLSSSFASPRLREPPSPVTSTPHSLIIMCSGVEGTTRSRFVLVLSFATWLQAIGEFH